MRKFLGLALAAMLALGAISAQAEPAYTLPLTAEPVTITFATAENAEGAGSYTNNLPVWAELEKRTGVKVEFQVTPATEYATAMQPRLAAGRDLPDVLRVPGDPVRFAKAGLILKLDDLIAQNAPNILALYAARPEVKAAMTAPDGSIYCLDSVVDARSMVNQVGLGMRKDWLKKLNLEEPVNIEQWRNVLGHFKTDDPNGNGQNDEIPVLDMPSSTTYAAKRNGLYKLGNAFGLHLYISEGWYFTPEGKVVYDWVSPQLKDYLTEMHLWYDAGYIDPEFVSNDSDKYTAKAIGDIAGSSMNDMTMQYPQWNERMAESFPGAHWEGITPPAMADGTRYMEKEQPTEGVYYAISKDCKDPALVMKWLDYMYASPEGQILVCNFGIEGDTYTLADGKPQLTDKILNHEKGSGIAMWAEGMNGQFPRILSADMIAQRFYRYTDEMAQSARAAEFYVPSFPRIIADKEETDKLVAIMSDIDVYRQEMVTGFITGTVSLDQFDEYIATMEDMGIANAIAIRQTQYDRVNGK